MHRPLLLSSVILCAACAAEPTPSSPRGGPRRVAWEQFCEQAMNVPQASAVAMARGAEGWELVAMYNGVLCYKRPVTPAAPAPGTPASTAPARSPTVPLMLDPGF